MSIAALVIAFACDAAEPAPAPGIHEVTAYVGAGGITAGLDAQGALAALRWPGPGAPEQMRQIESNRHEHPLWFGGGRWGLQIEGEWFWIGDASSRVTQQYVNAGRREIETRVSWEKRGLEVAQRTFVDAASPDVLTSIIEVRNAPAPPRIVWVGDFAPTTRQVPELAAVEGRMDWANDFAAFVETNQARGFAFRPEAPGKREFERARELATNGAGSESWASFGEGSWICAAAENRRAEAFTLDSAAALMDWLEDRLHLPVASVGHSCIVMDFGTGGRQVVQIAMGKSYERASRAVEEFHDRGQETPVPAEMDRTWWLDVIRGLRDAKTGFIVRGVSSEPAVGRDFPRDGAIAAVALFEAGDRDAALKTIEAYLSLVRMTEQTRRPAGSMPESVYASGEPASLHLVIDDRAPARVLWAAGRMLGAMGPNDQAGWMQKNWKAIRAAADFVSTWADARPGAPLYAEDPLGLSDALTQDRLFAQYAGMLGAIRLAEAGQQVVPDAWRNRVAQLGALAQEIVSSPERWHAGEALLLESEGLPDSVIAAAYDATLAKLRDAATRIADVDAGLILQAGLLAGKLGKSQDEILGAVAKRVAPNSGADSAVAARVLLGLR